MGKTQEEYYRGVRMAPYDLIKELVLAMVGVVLLALLFSVFVSSPDVAPVTIVTWSQSDPIDFVTTATGELTGTTDQLGLRGPLQLNSGRIAELGADFAAKVVRRAHTLRFG